MSATSSEMDQRWDDVIDGRMDRCGEKQTQENNWRTRVAGVGVVTVSSFNFFSSLKFS